MLIIAGTFPCEPLQCLVCGLCSISTGAQVFCMRRFVSETFSSLYRDFVHFEESNAIVMKSGCCFGISNLAVNEGDSFCISRRNF